MSVNTAHANNGVLIHSGETIILFSDNVSMEFSGQDAGLFKGTKTGKMYLTTHRMIFNSKSSKDAMQSFSMPFVCLTEVEVEQPVFGANYIRGKVRAQDNGNFTGEAKFKLLFKSGGAIDFAQSALKAAYIAKKYGNNASPPPYTPPGGAWHEAPPPAYSASPNGYYGWVPNTQAFPNPPPPNTVFMHDSPPPYPGIVPYGPTPNGYAGGPPNYSGYPDQSGFGAQPPAYPGNQFGGYPNQGVSYPGAQPNYPGSQPSYPNAQPGYPGSQPGYPATQPGYPGSQPGYPATQPGYPATQPGYPGSQPGYPSTQPAYPGAQPNYPGTQPGYPQWGNAGIQQSSSGGFSGNVVNNGPGFDNRAAGSDGPSAPSFSKEDEANQSSTYNARMTANQSNNGGFAPPPDMYESPPPSYNSLANKKQN